MSVISDAGELTGAAGQPRRLAVLAVLARAGDRGLQREKIVELLWTDVDADQARRTFAKALHALRRDLGDEEALVGGATDLRLNPTVITSDVREFELALGEGDLARAAALYAGPFLDGFRLPSAPEFERWVEVERDALSRDYELTLEKLATAENARGNHAAAVRWVRKLAAEDPLNARHALRLMRCLSDAGDRVGALHHARVYEALVEQELDLPPDREVVAFAQRLRQEQAMDQVPAVTPAPGLPNDPPIAGAPAPSAALPPAEVAGSAAVPLRAISARRVSWWLTAVGLVGIAAVWAIRQRGAASARDDASVIAVGRITDYRQRTASELARPLGDMLATNLARVPELRVLSTARMYELLALRDTPDTGSGAMIAAARRAGAQRLVDGALFQLGNGHLRLDLRLVDLTNGNVIAARSVTGADPFGLVDSATALLVAESGLVAPSGSIGDVSTRSMLAYRLYDEGLRAYTSGEYAAALRLFESASDEDSTFAMAAFYAARAAQYIGSTPRVWQLYALARRKSARATERERLLIELEFRLQTYSPLVRALADSFVARYPHDVDGYLYAGTVAIGEGRFGDAIANLSRVVEMDSLGQREVSARCAGCEAMTSLLVAYQAMDSIDAMVREGRRWTTLQPKSASSWRHLTGALAAAGRVDEANAALRTSGAFSSERDEPEARAHLRVRAGNFADADRELRDVARSNDAGRRSHMTWWLALSLRQQGKLDDALVQALEYRRDAPGADAARGLVPSFALVQAQVYFERGDYARSAALFDSMATVTSPQELESFAARNRLWFLTHAATARAAMRDTIALRWMIDSIRSIGARTYLGRDHRLHHYARGLLLVARGRDEDAVSELREAVWSPTIGLTRVNYELGKAYLRLGRPRDAIAILQPALHGPLDASNFYVTQTELHELLGWSWLAAGGRDSAVVHLQRVVDAWAHADSRFTARRDSAARELARR